MLCQLSHECRQYITGYVLYTMKTFEEVSLLGIYHMYIKFCWRKIIILMFVVIGKMKHETIEAWVEAQFDSKLNEIRLNKFCINVSVWWLTYGIDWWQSLNHFPCRI